MFADDLVIWHTSNSTIISQRRIQEDLDNLELYCSLWKLKINSTKTVYSIFTQSDKVAARNLTLTINDITLSKDVNPVYLGVQLDQKLSMNNRAGRQHAFFGISKSTHPRKLPIYLKLIFQ